MDRERFSHLAHRSLAFANPVSGVAIDRSLALAGLGPAARVLDIGCGKAELLIRAAEQFGARGVGVEKSGLMFEEAVARMGSRGVAERVLLHRADAAAWLAEQPVALSAAEGLFDLVCCVGSSHALLSAGPALDAMAMVTRPGGFILLGEGYWRTPPSREYLEALGAQESEMTTHAGNIELARSRGLIGWWCVTASDRDWDEYEWAYARGIESFAAECPEDPDVAAMTDRIRKWSRTYAAHGRATLGFGLYLFRRP